MAHFSPVTRGLRFASATMWKGVQLDGSKEIDSAKRSRSDGLLLAQMLFEDNKLQITPRRRSIAMVPIWEGTGLAR